MTYKNLKIEIKKEIKKVTRGHKKEEYEALRVHIICPCK